MTKIEHYLTDGACWQAQMVLAYLRSHRENILDAGEYDREARCYDARIEVGRFENCREQGYVFSINTWKHTEKQGNWWVYEHRNVDHAVVVFYNKKTVNTPTLDDFCEAIGDDKYNVTKDFGYDIMALCEWIEQDMREWLEDVYAD